MEKRCPKCGTKLLETNYGRLHCPNHGIICMEEEKSKEEDPDYIG